MSLSNREAAGSQPVSGAARGYSKADDALIVSLRAEGMSWGAIGAVFGKRGSSIYCRAVTASLPVEWGRNGPGAATANQKKERRQPEKPKLRQRACLCCRGQFMSWGPGNRMCRACRDSDLV